MLSFFTASKREYNMRAMYTQSVILSGRWEYIMNMYTLPGYRNRGICGKILELLVGEEKKDQKNTHHFSSK